jgi:hypothetical protein
MARLTAAAYSDRRVPQRIGQLTTIFPKIRGADVGLSVGTISIGDRIDIAKLSPGFRLTYASHRVTGDLSVSGSPTVQLVAVIDGTSYALTTATAANAASNATMSIAPLAAALTLSSDSYIALSVAGGTLDRTLSTAWVEVMLKYETDDA